MPIHDSHRRWLATLEKFRRDPARPATSRHWSSLDTASEDELHRVRSEKLQAAVQYVYDCIPFHRRKWQRIGLEPGDIRSLDDLTKIPVTTRHEMAADTAEHPPWGTFTAVSDDLWRTRGWQMFATSGTTGQPRVFRYTTTDRDLFAWADARALWSIGLRPGRDVAMLAFGYGPHVWLWGVHFALQLMGIPIVTAGGLDSRVRARFIDLYRPTVLACTPSYGLYLAQVMREMGLDPASSSVNRLCCAGEPGFSVPSTRQRLEDTWRADLHEFYGCTEAAPCGGGHTCMDVVAQKGGLVRTHLMGDTHLWEAVSSTDFAPVPLGQRGLSVVTNLCSEASPQPRFLVGDFTTLDARECSCGRTGPSARGGFLGRADDMLNIRGVTLFPSALEDAIRRVRGLAEEFQILVTTEHDLDVLTVQVEPDATSPGAHAALARQVETEIVSRCELRPVVQVLPYGTLPKTEFKARRIKDQRPAPPDPRKPDDTV